jgi:hypothetical protein
MTDDDGLMAQLKLQLEAAGFVLTGHVESHSFGDERTSFHRGGLNVRIVRDRGQWFLDVASDASGGWHDVRDWIRCAKTEDIGTLDKMSEMAAALFDHLADLEGIGQNPQIADRLAQIERDRTHRFFQELRP